MFVEQVLMVLFLSSLSGQVRSIDLDELFPHGSGSGDNYLDKNKEDDNSVEVELGVPFVFYQRQFDSLYINENGFVSFLTEVPIFYNVQMPMDYPMIAPFYTDVDTRSTGQVYWRVSKSKDDLDKANSFINPRFRSTSFSCSEVVVVTWSRVGAYNKNSDKVNTFQLILASDGYHSFAIFLYPKNGIQWIRGDGKDRNSPDARAQAGIMFLLDRSRYHLLPFSGKDQIRSIGDYSNTDTPGLWIYKIGRIDTDESVVQPDNFSREENISDTGSCDQGRSLCHSEASCRATGSGGFCCACDQQWYGNGENCLKNDMPQRVKGRMNGIINGVRIDEQDLHCYVVTNDGKTYTAVSSVNNRIGWSLQGLVPVGTAISWLFALPKGKGKNGFGLTGGEFNYTAVVKYPNTDDTVKIQMLAKGMNVFDYLTADMEVTGTIPNIPEKAKIKVETQTMHFIRTQPGFIRSKGEHSYFHEGKGKSVPYTVEQTISWTECSGSLDTVSRTMKLINDRNFIIYDEEEEIVRYAMRSTISDVEGTEDLCKMEPCGPNSICIPDSDSYSCECEEGFILSAPDGCKDKDECQSDEWNNCGSNSICINNEGSYGCECSEGYVGDGYECYEKISCSELDCGQNSKCTVNKYGQGQCECIDGYEMVGKMCKFIPSKVSLRGFASPDKITSTFNELNTDIGPLVEHNYDVTNHGPYDVGHLVVNFSWPLQDESGSWLLYLRETPFIQYASGERERCDIDPVLINSLDLNLSNRKKRDSTNPDYEMKVYGVLYEDPEYDYSALTEQLMSLNDYSEDEDTVEEEEVDESNYKIYEDDDFEMEAEEPDDLDYELSELELPESQQVLLEKIVTKDLIAPSYKGKDTYGRIHFLCKLKLAVNERATVKIMSHVSSKQIKKTYESVSKLSFKSTAEILIDELIKTKNGARKFAKTILSVQDPLYAQGPGLGVQCRDKLCHKYATCSIIFEAQSNAVCQCPDGFQGDGIETCEPGEVLPPIMEKDCRTERICGENAECVYQAESSMYKCVCLPGYFGNGVTCNSDSYSPNSEQEKSSVPHECSNDSDCKPSKYCLDQGEQYARVCRCKPGFFTQGDSCIPNQKAGCDLIDKCADTAECVRDSVTGNHECRCLSGFQGNGTYCQRELVIGCNIIENCGKFATCEYEYQSKGYRCICDSARGFSGDGFTCKPAQHCRFNPAVCHPNADCLDLPDSDHGCRCKLQFKGDGLSCDPLPKFEGNFAIVAQGMALIKVPMSGRGSRPLNIKSDQLSAGVDFDCSSGMYYWTDTNNKMIKRSLVSGSNSVVEDFYIEGLRFPEGLAVDWVSRNMYITDPGREAIDVISLDTRASLTLITEGLNSPRGIAVHPVLGKLYWTDWDRYFPRIQMANMDGSNVQILVNNKIFEPNSIAVDLFNYEVCWTDAGDQSNNIKPKIDCIGANGSGRRTVIELSLGDYPYGIAITESSILWTDWKRKYVHSVDKRTGANRRSIPYMLANTGRPYDLVNIPVECPNLSNSCQGQPCGLYGICLPSGQSSHVCR